MIVFAAGVACWLALQGTLATTVLWSRPLPPEVDDVYAYVVKAAQLESCPLQDCAALEDLRAQLTVPSADPAVAWARYRAHHRAFAQYHLVHSLLLAVLHKAGLTWEGAYKTVWLGGILLFGMGIAAFLRVLWGGLAAGVALMLLAPQLFPEQGLHYVVPSNLALGVALFVWARVIQRRGDAGWTLTLGGAVMVLLHPTGQLYALVAVALVWALGGDHSLRRKAWLTAGPLGWVVLVGLVLPALIHRPLLGFKGDQLPQSVGMWANTGLSTLQKVAAALEQWMAPHDSALVVGVLIVIGYVTTDAQRQRTLTAVAVITTAIAVAGLVYVLPAYPAELFLRIWIALALFLTGAVGQAVVSGVREGAAAVMGHATPDSLVGRVCSRHPAHVVRFVALAVLMTLAAMAVDYGAYRLERIRGTVLEMRDRHDVALDRSQPALLAERSQPGDKVLYTDEITMPFFLSHGTIHRGAVYLPPALENTPEASEWLTGQDLRFAAVSNPIQVFAPRYYYGELPLDRVDALRLEMPTALSLRELAVHIRNRGGGGHMRATVARETPRAAGTASDIVVLANSDGWIQFGLDTAAKSFVIEFEGLGKGSYLAGIRFGDRQLNWPWPERARLTIRSRGENAAATASVVVSFDAFDLLPRSLQGAGVRRDGVEVLADGGSSIVIKLHRPSP